MNKLDTGWASFLASLVAAFAAITALIFNRRSAKQDKKEETQTAVAVAQIEGAAEFRKELREHAAEQDKKIERLDTLVESLKSRLETEIRERERLHTSVERLVDKFDAVLARPTDGEALRSELVMLIAELRKVLAAQSGVIGG